MRVMHLALAGLVATACINSQGHGDRKQAPERNRALGGRIALRHAELAYETYRAAAEGARALQTAIEQLASAPTVTSLSEARWAWRVARVPYTRGEAFRFYGGPIDDVEPQINAWPVDESLIDYVEDGPGGGLINDAGAPPITRALLKALNEREGEKNILLGFHPLEFLLWGQDLRADGPGARPIADFQANTRAGARRLTYLKEAAALLVDQLDAVVDAWSPDRLDNYRARFLRRPPEEAVGLILKGLGRFSGPELTGERLTVAYETKDQENEHSCFSDNTRDDLVGDLEGLERVYRGGDAGPGLGALLPPALAARLDRALAASVAAGRALPAPFDQAIVGNDAAPGRRAIKALIAALTAQSQVLEEAAAVLDVRVALR